MLPIRCLLCLLLATCSLPVIAGQSPPEPIPPSIVPAFTTLQPFAAHYEVRLNNLPFKANAYQTLTALDDDSWRLELRVESFLLNTKEVSEFRWNGKQCHTIPESYRYTRKGIGRNRALEMRFDFASKQVTRNDGKTISTFAIDNNAEDKLGHTLALACRIARGARGTLAVDVAWDRDVRHFDYLIAEKEETVKTPAGTFQTLLMQRTREDNDRITSSWIAASAGWQPVQMRHSEGDGKTFQLQLLDIK